MTKKIIIAVLTIVTIVVIYSIRTNTSSVEIGRDSEYLGPNVDSPSLTNEEINF